MEIIGVIGTWMQAGELRNFIKVWISVCSSLCFCYYASKNIVRKGQSRLLLVPIIIPVICLNLVLPLSLNTLHLGISTAFFLCWLGNFKLFMFAFGKGPLSDPSLSVSSFVALACLPIKFKQSSTTSQLLLIPRSIWNYALKLLVLVLLLGGYEYYVDQHRLSTWAPWLLSVIYCCHLYVAMEIIFAIVGGLAGSVLGIEIEPPFDEPYLSSSPQEFWGRRWNIMVTRVLHPSVYEPVLNICTRVTGSRKWAPLPAMLSTFIVSGIMHELLFYYMGRKWPTWQLSCFFLLHGVCVVVEVAIKKAIGHSRRRRGLPRIIAAPLTVSFVTITSLWLFFPELLRHNAMNRAFEEYAVMGAFFRDVAKALGLTF